jgi:enoyl-CoA hydratase/carnithine racemase
MTVIAVEARGDVAIVTLDRPDKLNAINDEMLEELLEAVETIGRDDAIGAVVLTGRGRAFSAGGDIAAMDAMDDVTFGVTIDRYMRLAIAIRARSKPFIAAVHGYALAGGFELALLCDIRLAARGTQFGLPDTALGLSPTSGMTWLLPRVIGLGRAMDLTLRAQNIDADEAERIGLVSEVTEQADLLPTAEALGHRIAGYPQEGVAWTKLGFIASLEGDFEAATEREAAAELACFRSPETRARFRAFVDRERG